MLGSPLEKVPAVRKIAVVRANGLGDFIFILPALEALRVAYPEAEIVLLAKSWHRDFLKDRPGPVDRVVVVPPCRGVGVDPDSGEEDVDVLEEFFEQMRRERFDLALQLHGGGHYSNPFVLQLGARMTVGSKTPDAPPLDRWLPYIYFQHEILRYLEIVSLVGAVPVVLEPRVTVTEKDLDEVRRVAGACWAPQRLVALHPGANAPQRRWPPEKFAAVGDVLATAGAQVVVTGTREEQQIGETIVHAMHAPAHNLCGCLSLGGLAGLLSGCRVVVSNDTGPLHLATAVGAATVGLFWCYNLVNVAPLARMRHRPFSSWRLTCPICGKDCTRSPDRHEVSFIADISTQEVIDAALDLFRACQGFLIL